MEEILAGFGISKEQVLSVTTDNGSNFVRMARLCTESDDEMETSSDADSESSQCSVTSMPAAGN